MSVAVDHAADRPGVWERVRTAPLETTIVLTGMALVALHVVDDSFLQPEAGVSPADHLVSGLIPVALLGCAALAYPRLRPGRRAAIAIVVGLLGVVLGGVEAAYYANKTGLSDDDFTGLLAAVAGVTLVVVGVVVAWRGRSREGTRARRYGRRGALGLAWVVGLGVVLFPFGVSYGLTHAARPPTPSGDLGAPYERVSFEASDGLRLDGWLTRSENGANVIVYPGKKGTQRHARMLARHGYGVLVFDRRGEGTSEGDPNALGWGFDRDLLGAIAFLRGRSDVDANRIGGLGLSVGGEALLQTAAETTALKAVVSEGAGARSVREDAIDLPARRIPDLVTSVAVTAGTALFSNRLPPPSLKDLAGRIESTPVFFIYAAHGQGGEDKNPVYYRAAHVPKQLWRIDTKHTHGLSARPQEYERRVVGFFDHNLGG